MKQLQLSWATPRFLLSCIVVTAMFITLFSFLLEHALPAYMADDLMLNSNVTLNAEMAAMDAQQRLQAIIGLVLMGIVSAMGISYFRSSCRHIAERERLLAELRESLRVAQAANSSKNDFLANMSHELRTPMNGVLGMAQLLADTSLDEEQKEYVATINGSGETLLMLLNDILDFSKIEAGALELEHMAFDLTETVEETVNLLRPAATKKTIGVSVECASDLPHFIWGDSGRVRQVLTNLVGNAIKFTEHGFVKVAVARSPANGDTLRLSVEDTGMGIHHSKLQTIFDKFTQADNSMARKYGGTGLGLTISKQLVEKMGGSIHVDSQEGRGSTFTVELPIVEASADDCLVMCKTERIHRANRTLVNVATSRVLLVEDYPTNQWFAQKLLFKFGFRNIDLASNGLEAVMAWQSNQYDAIFMDCQMPEMDGYAATEEIRQMEIATGNRVPIIAMTANAMVGDREKCLHVGMDDYLSKPLRTKHVYAVLSDWFVLPDAEAFEEPVAAPKVLSINSPVDLEQLNQFTNGDLEEEKNLFALYDEQATMILAALEQSLETHNNEEWRSAAHRLKGASANLGANTLQKLCAKAEAEATSDAATKGAMLNDIHAELARITSFFRERAAA